MYRAPEVILQTSYGPAIDIWAFACAIYELATSQTLFNPESDHEHLTQMIELLGDFPQTLATSGARAEKFFRQDDGWQLLFDTYYQLALIRSIQAPPTFGAAVSVRQLASATQLGQRPSTSVG